MLRLATVVTGDRDFVVIGSQSIHGAFGPAVLEGPLTSSMEADVLPLLDHDGDKAELLQTIGLTNLAPGLDGTVEVDGVSIRTAALPVGWTDRLIPLLADEDDPDGTIGWCLDPHDLGVAKAVAGRANDIRYLEAMARKGLIDPAAAAARLDDLDPGCARPDVAKVIAAQALLQRLHRAEHLFQPRPTTPPKGRRRPARSDFADPPDPYADFKRLPAERDEDRP